MIEPSLSDALRDAANDVLERMFFIECLSEPGELAAEPEVVARLTFDGDPAGELELRISASAARSISADFLGAEPSDLSEQEIRDVVSELANMICGAVLSRAKSSATFRLATPRIMEQSSDMANLPNGGVLVAHAVGLGSGRLAVSMRTETSKWSAVPK